MFNLEEKIAEWRVQMLAAGIQSPVPLEELEIHLREEIGRQIKLGAGEQQAFETAVAQIGNSAPIKNEFKKVEVENWNRPLAGAAWTLFTVSFFLPSFNGFFSPMWGWQCAAESVRQLFAPDNWSDWWSNLHLESLTLANVLMLASTFLLPRLSKNAHALKWLRFANFVAVALVWSFLIRGIADGSGKDLKIGCYVWASSFLLLSLSALKIRHQTLAIKYV